MKGKKTIMVSVAILWLLSMGLTACRAEPTPPPAAATPAPTPAEYAFTLATSPPPSGFYAIGVSVADVMSKYSPNVSVTGGGMPGGTPSHYIRLEKKQVEIGLATASSQYLAVRGLLEYKDKPHPDLRMLMFHGAVPLHLVVRADSGIETLEQLEGKKFGPGFLGTTSADTIVNVLTAIGIKPEFIEKGLSDLLDDVKNRRIVGLGKGSSGMSIDSAIQQLMATTEVRVLSFTEEQMEKAKAAHPYYNWYRLPAGTYPGQGEILTVGLTVGWSGTKDMPEEAAYQVTKAVTEHFDELVKLYAAFKGIEVAEFTMNTLKDVPSPLHPGSVRYFREKGYTVPEAAIPPEMK